MPPVIYKNDVLLLLVLGLSTLTAPEAAGQTQQPRRPGRPGIVERAVPLRQSMRWHDGEKERRVWLNPQIMAEVDELQPLSETELRREFPAATLEVRRRLERTRLWRVGTTTSAGTSSAKQAGGDSRAKARTKLRLSEVFHSRGSSRAPMMILPGGLILKLREDWTEAQCQDFIRARGLTVKNQLDSLKNTFLVATDPGLPTLERANGLLAEDGVLAAIPNWKLELARK